jgi:hypothetical protein
MNRDHEITEDLIEPLRSVLKSRIVAIVPGGGQNALTSLTEPTSYAQHVAGPDPDQLPRTSRACSDLDRGTGSQGAGRPLPQLREQEQTSAQVLRT